MASNKYIYYAQLLVLLKDYYLTNHQPMNFIDALKLAKQKKLYTNKKNFPKRRTHLSEKEFLHYTEYTQIDLDYHLDANRVIKDSSLIPNNLNLFALRNIMYTKQMNHPHNCFDIHYVYSGHALLMFEDEVRYIEEGQVCILTPKSNYRIITEDEDDIVITIYIRNSSFEEIFFQTFTEYDLISQFIRNVVYLQENKTNYLLFRGNNLEDTKEIIQNIYIETNYPDAYSNITTIQWVNLLFATILRDFSFEHSYFYLNNKKNIHFVKILSYVQNNYKTITIKKIADEFHYNESYISTMFLNYLGSNFTSIVTKLKMNHAKSLLLETNLTINEISEIVGYTSVDHFSRTFKKETSLSPSVYRKRKE